MFQNRHCRLPSFLRRTQPAASSVRVILLCLTTAGISLGLYGCERPADLPSVPAPNQEATAQPGDAAVKSQGPGVVRLHNVADLTDLRFKHHAAGRERYFFPAIMAGGAALNDFDGDGDSDCLLLDSQLPNVDPRLVDQHPHSLFFLDAAGRFAEAPREHRIEMPPQSYATGCAVGDVNNDGMNDIYITAWGPDQLFLNIGARFRRIAEECGIENSRWGTSAAFLDYDRDGWLDLYVANYVEYDPGHDCIDSSGRIDFCNPAVFPRTTDRLFRNISDDSPGQVRFKDVTAESGIAAVKGAGLGVLTADFNNDGWIDIYVANDGHANVLWINQKDGTFKDEAIFLGVAYDAAGQGQGSMGLAIGDVNGDLSADLLVTNLDGESNSLYVSSEGGFRDESMARGISRPSFGRTGFGTALTDLDNDGDSDIIVLNGRVRRSSEQPGSNGAAPSFSTEYAEAADVLICEGSDFVTDATDGNMLSKTKSIGRSLCLADINRDGLTDCLVTSLDQPAMLFQNRTNLPGHWLNVRVIEPARGGRDAIGATVTLTTQKQTRRLWLHGGGSYQCSSDFSLHFGLGSETEIQELQVLWPDGTTETFPATSADQSIVLKHGEGSLKTQ
ncbi:MAG: CRTAC1 family protein [Planctomycetaceae bacterium]